MFSFNQKELSWVSLFLLLTSFSIFNFCHMIGHVYDFEPSAVPGNALPVIALPAIALPAIASKDAANRPISIGGHSDATHLGGFIKIDWHSISPAVWKFMIEYFGIKSLLDVGCGKGISTTWFILHGVKAQCVEGSHDGVSNTLLPDPNTQLVEHDFTLGPWWPSQTVDAIWCMEVTEHIARHYQHNYFESFKKAAFIFVSHAPTGYGWHHVEVHDNTWWQARWESFGLVYSHDLTKLVQDVARNEKEQRIPRPDNATLTIGAGYIISGNFQVFINPAVASLKSHAHLLSEPGCVDGFLDKNHTKRLCSGASDTLPQEGLQRKN